MLKYAQTPTLKTIFDLSEDYFAERKRKGIFKKGIHYFEPETTSKTRKAVLWDIEAVETWIRGVGAIEADEELKELLNR